MSTNELIQRLPSVTASWTCPYFEAIFALSLGAIATGVGSDSTAGTLVAVVSALLIGSLMGKRHLRRNLHGESC